MKRLASIFLGVFGGIVWGCGGSGSSIDGGTPDGSQNDGPNNNDVNSQDSPTSTDASEAGNSDGEAGQMCPDFCASITPTPAFCSDFDMEMTPADWTTTVTTMGGTVTVESTEEVSCPNGLESSLPMITNTMSTSVADAKVRKDLMSISVPTGATLTIDVYLPAVAMTDAILFFGVRSTNDTNSGAYLTHHGDGRWFVSNLEGLDIALTEPPLTGAWNLMTLQVTFGNKTGGSASLMYTGADNTMHTATGMGETVGMAVSGPTVEVGMEADGNTSAAFNAYYDNVVVKTM